MSGYIYIYVCIYTHINTCVLFCIHSSYYLEVLTPRSILLFVILPTYHFHSKVIFGGPKRSCQPIIGLWGISMYYFNLPNLTLSPEVNLFPIINQVK